MYDEKGIDLLLSISKRCIASEDTVRMTCQVLRVITAANGLPTAHSSQLDIGTTLLLQNDRVIQLLDSVVNLGTLLGTDGLVEETGGNQCADVMLFLCSLSKGMVQLPQQCIFM